MARNLSSQDTNPVHDKISINFNGRNTTAKKWVNEAVALTDQDRMKNWREEEPKGDNLKKITETMPTDEPVPKQTGPLDWRHFENKQTAATLLHQPIKNKKKSQSKRSDFVIIIKKFWVPFLSAIIVGLGLGFTVLLMLANHNAATPNQNILSASQGGITQNVPTTQDKTPVTTVSGKNYLLNLQVVQLGVWSSQASALDAKNQYDSSGINSAIIKDHNQYALFAGMALTKSDLVPLEQTLKNKVTYYEKSYVINPKTIKGTKRDLQDIKTANLVIQNLIPLSLSAITSETVDQSVLNEVKKALDQMEDPSEGASNKDLVTLKGTLVAAYTALTQAKPDGLSAQKALLDSMVTYQSIIQSREK